MSSLVHSIRGSFGYSVRRGLDEEDEIVGLSLDPKVNLMKCLKFSDDGAYLAYCDSTKTVVVDAKTGKELFSADLPKTCEIVFSPKGTYMITYQLYVIWGLRKNEDGSERTPDPNLRIWSVKDGKLLATLIAAKQPNWRPQFSSDEAILIRLQGSEVMIYEAPNFEKHARKVVVKNVAQVVLSPGANSLLGNFIPSVKGQPAMLQMRRMDDKLAVIQSKVTGFRGSSCAIAWNTKGAAFLACVMEEVDKTNKSYYGSSFLYCIPQRKDTFKVELDKQGPIYSYEWAPDSSHFCVCYGFMPSKACVYDMKGNVVWDLGEGHRNEVHFNRFGNILALCAFGNISSGKIQLWDVASKKEIASWDVNCTTHFAWAPDGQHFYAATTAPRLRINNCYRLFHYTGALKREVKYDKEELWEVAWCPSSAGYERFTIEGPTDGATLHTYNSEKRLLDERPKGGTIFYRPPGLRNRTTSEEQSSRIQKIAKENLKPRKLNALPRVRLANTGFFIPAPKGPTLDKSKKRIKMKTFSAQKDDEVHTEKSTGDKASTQHTPRSSSKSLDLDKKN